MNREIKFSFIMQHEETGHIIDKRSDLGELVGSEFIKQVAEHSRYSVINIRQYTRLKDKNGKEIYEGDLVTTNGTEVAIVEQGLGYYGLVYASDIKDPSINKPIKPSSYNWDKILNLIEIIGNIYENPELLRE